MKYLKVFTDFAKTIEPLNSAERGRLFTAMLEYAESGTEPEFSGNERFIWPTAKLHIDREDEFCKKQKENGAKGGRKPNETQPNPSEPNLTQKSQKDKDKEKKRKEYKETTPNGVEKKSERFSAPTLEEVKAYCLERKNGVDAERWYNYYSANGWMVGKNHMKDWKAAVRTWEKESGDAKKDGNGWMKQYAKSGIGEYMNW